MKIDSKLTFEEAIAGKEIPEDVKNSLILIDVEYVSFDNEIHRGQLVVNKKIEKDVREIFEGLLEMKFPIEKMIPIVKYNWSDEDSMADNNTSCFNYRFIHGTQKLSKHSYGIAIDLNPRLNPVTDNGKNYPIGAEYDQTKPGTITKDGEVVRLFLGRGFIWGGNWTTPVDRHHFQKEI